MLKKIGDLFSKTYYSGLQNQRVLEKNYEQINQNIQLSKDLLVQNTITNRANLLTLIGGLIAFIGFIQGQSQFEKDIWLKLTIGCFLVVIFTASIVAVVAVPVDVKLIQKKLKLLISHKFYTKDQIEKMQKMQFSKADADDLLEAQSTLIEQFNQKDRYTVFEQILQGLTFIYSTALIIGMFSCIIFYSKHFF